MGTPDTGQQTARELYAAATGSGGAVFEIAEDVARNLAAACDRLVEDLQRVRRADHLLTAVTGFPELPSGCGLARGFGDKGREFVDTVLSFQETALLFKAAYLAAGKHFAEAEAANRAALELAAARLEAR
ncbi:hypothetical protein BJY24_003224 [Nocardia transvalensis]|uniref:Excreted virulence factor EspC (Type VII ESX diderm) n=1 Tax=Nocardia transvalensis TaxID=37333 RepID=A0A7W9UIM8_9NOCA|nr:hypothetical protein [Nocardia transvalensis]MBB5914357.1 hypothetical protein [Nocardia transvalensis]